VGTSEPVLDAFRDAYGLNDPILTQV
jgi:hypothetical protein